jgi:hypothetical protein
MSTKAKPAKTESSGGAAKRRKVQGLVEKSTTTIKKVEKDDDDDDDAVVDKKEQALAKKAAKSKSTTNAVRTVAVADIEKSSVSAKTPAVVSKPVSNAAKRKLPEKPATTEKKATITTMATAQNKKKETKDAESPATAKPLNYMQRANPPGKKRDVGGEKRNRKEQMPVEEQIQASIEVAEALEARVAADSLLANDAAPFLLPRATAPPKKSLVLTELNTINSPALDTSVIIGRKNVPKQCGEICATNPLCQRIMAEKWASNSAAENSGDCGTQPPPGSAITKTTRSADLKPRDLTMYEKRKYKDNTFEEQVIQAQRDEFLSACNHIANSVIVNKGSTSREDAEALYRRSGYGESIITMEDFDVTAASSDGKKCGYPMRSQLRCRYDHHRFDSVPVLLPLRWYPAKNLLSVNSRMVFCSFSCALAYIEREMPHDIARAERRSLLEHVARTFFAVTETLRPAPFIEQHEDYGGTLNTGQFRALGNTHYSFIEQPIACVAVPCKISTQIVMHQRVDRAKRQALNLRTREEHMNAVPDEPVDPLAARVDNGGRGGADGGKKRKERVAPDEHGKRVVVNREHLDAKISAAAKRKAAQQPTVKHALGNLLVEQSLDNAGGSIINNSDTTSSTNTFTASSNAPSNAATKRSLELPPPPKTKKAKSSNAPKNTPGIMSFFREEE